MLTAIRLIAFILIVAILGSMLTPWMSPVIVACLGLLAFRVWVRHVSPDDATLVPLLGVIFLGHITFATTLFAVSYFRLPLMQDLQFGGGFWSFARDADGYHLRALQLLETLRQGQALPELQPAVVYDLFVAGVYGLFGPLPLTPVVLNCWLVVAAGLLAYLTARRMGADARSCYGALIVVACWPSGFMWSSQLLRDSLALFLTFASILAVALMFHVPPRNHLVAVARVIFLVVTTVALASVRIYTAWLIAATGLAISLALRFGLVVTIVRWRTVLLASVLLLAAAAVGSGNWLSNVDRMIETAMALRSARAMSERLLPNSRGTGAEDKSSSFGEDKSSSFGMIREGAAVVIGALNLVPRLVEQKRRELLIGSNASIGPYEELMTWPALLSFLPEGLASALFSPFPWDWRMGQTTGIFKPLALFESFTMIVFLPVLVVGLTRTIRERACSSSFVLVYAVATLVFLALIIPNVGGLVRLRSQALLPLLTLAIAKGGLLVYQKVVTQGDKSVQRLLSWVC